MRTFLIAAVATTLLAGCTTAQNISRSRGEIADSAVMADAALSKLREGKPSSDDGGVRIIEDQAYIAPAAQKIASDKRLPSTCNITFAPSGTISLQAFGQHVTKICGIPVRVTPDAVNALNGATAQAGSPQAPAQQGVGLPAGIPMLPGANLPPPVLGGQNSMGLAAAPLANGVDIRYSGELAGLLDAVTSRLGLSWRFRTGAITIFYTETRLFQLFSIPSVTETQQVITSGNNIAQGSTGGGMSGGMSGAAGASSGGVSGANNTTTTTTQTLSVDAAKDVSSAIDAMLTPGIGRKHFAGSTGLLAVTDTPEVLDTIQDFVESQNTFRTKQVLLNVEVLSVKVNTTDELGINWNVIYRSLADQYGIGLVSSFATSTDAISGSINILEGDSRFSGSELVINALSKQGDILSRKSPSTATLNMEPVSVQVATQTGYIASSTSTQTTDVGTSSSLQPGSVTAGFVITMLPYIMPDDKTMLLQLSLGMSDLLELRRFEKGNAVIDNPDLANQFLNNKVRIRSGETLVLAGLETLDVKNTKSGTGNPRFWLFGGGVSASKTREVLVVLITPIVT